MGKRKQLTADHERQGDVEPPAFMKRAVDEQSEVPDRDQHLDGAHAQHTRLAGAEVEVQAACVGMVDAVFRHIDLMDGLLCK